MLVKARWEFVGLEEEPGTLGQLGILVYSVWCSS